MLIYVDIDDTICSSSKNLDYTQAKPDYKKIKVINKLYEKGHEIIYWTARGRLTKIDWFDITKNSLILGEQNIHRWIPNQNLHTIY